MSIEVGSTMGPQGGFMASQFDAAIPVADAVKGSDDYEFNVLENAVLRTLAGRTRLTASAMTGVTLAQVLLLVLNPHADFAGLVGAIIGAVISGFIAMTLFTAAKEFRAITETQGNDLTHLIAALAKLSRAFLVQGIVLTLSFGFFALVALLLLMRR